MGISSVLHIGARCDLVHLFQHKGGRDSGHWDLLPAYTQFSGIKPRVVEQDISHPRLTSLHTCIDEYMYIHTQERKGKYPPLVTQDTDSYPVVPCALWESVCAHTQATLDFANLTLRSPRCRLHLVHWQVSS